MRAFLLILLFKHMELEKEVIARATESNVAKSVLDASVQFATSIDRMNSERINEVVKNQRELSSLKVDNERLNNKLELAGDDNSIKVIHNQFGCPNKTIYLNLDDSRLKDLVNEAKDTEIDNLKSDLKYAEEAKRIINKEIRNLKTEHENYVYDLKKRISDDERFHQENIRSIRIQEAQKLKKFKEGYSSSLNYLHIQSSIMKDKLIALRRYIKPNWFSKHILKLNTDLINSLSNFSWNLDELNVASN